VKGWGWIALLLLAGSWSSSASSAPAPSLPPPRPRRRSPAPPVERTHPPTAPQPEPSDDDLELDPSSPKWPAFADLHWVQYAEDTARPGPKLTDVDYTIGSGPRELTTFERWAIGPYIPKEYPRALDAVIKSDTAGVARLHRWALQRAARAAVLSFGAPLDVADRVLRLAARGLYEQARDFYRGG
jgi:hypothetical protein